MSGFFWALKKKRLSPPKRRVKAVWGVEVFGGEKRFSLHLAPLDPNLRRLVVKGAERKAGDMKFVVSFLFNSTSSGIKLYRARGFIPVSGLRLVEREFISEGMIMDVVSGVTLNILPFLGWSGWGLLVVTGDYYALFEVNWELKANIPASWRGETTYISDITELLHDSTENVKGKWVFVEGVGDGELLYCGAKPLPTKRGGRREYIEGGILRRGAILLYLKKTENPMRMCLGEDLIPPF